MLMWDPGCGNWKLEIKKLMVEPYFPSFMICFVSYFTTYFPTSYFTFTFTFTFNPGLGLG